MKGKGDLCITKITTSLKRCNKHGLTSCLLEYIFCNKCTTGTMPNNKNPSVSRYQIFGNATCLQQLSLDFLPTIFFGYNLYLFATFLAFVLLNNYSRYMYNGIIYQFIIMTISSILSLHIYLKSKIILLNINA